jgi:hypothetical protein
MSKSRREINQEQIEWRRDKVQELHSKGYGIREIGRTLEISHSTITRDLQVLRQHAKEGISRYIDEYLPAEYQETLVGLRNIIRMQWQVAENTEDKREKTAALSLIKDCLAMKLDMLGSASVMERAIRLAGNYHNNNSGISQPQADLNEEVRVEDGTAGLT